MAFEPEIAPTVRVAPWTKTKEKDHKSDLISPVKKKQKKEEIKVTCGMPGPGGTRTLDLGGTGDCAWRCLAFQLAMTNCGWTRSVADIRPKVEQLSMALRAQTLHYLLNTDTTWKESWTRDTKWTQMTEDGPPATSLDEFVKVLGRPNRWI